MFIVEGYLIQLASAIQGYFVYQICLEFPKVFEPSPGGSLLRELEHSMHFVPKAQGGNLRLYRHSHVQKGKY